MATLTRETQQQLAHTIAIVSDLSATASLPAPLLCLLPDLDGTAAADTSRCGPRPILSLGPLLLAAPEPELYAVLAHEIAHHVSDDQGIRRIGRLSLLTCGLTWLAAGAAALTQARAAVALAAVAGLARLTARWCQRREEHRADAAAVAYLDQLGLPGLEYVTAALSAAAPGESAWYARLGWLWDTHPTIRQRLRHLTCGGADVATRDATPREETPAPPHSPTAVT